MTSAVLKPFVLAASLLICSGAVTAQSAALPTYTNALGMDFVRIPAGSFTMGFPQGDGDAAVNEKPAHRVTIGKSFYMARLELTQAQWEAVMGSNPYTLDRSNPYYNLPGMAARITRPDHPATVSWNDAQDFIERLNRRADGGRYRLPTEAEWEYAARAGTVTAYSFGDDARQLERYAWHGANFATGGTHPVGQKPANAWGLHDVHGNAWEWVQDLYDPNFYASSPAVDPVGPRTGRDRVVRGGSWHSIGDGWRSASRRAYAPDYRGISIGLRLVREAE